MVISDDIAHYFDYESSVKKITNDEVNELKLSLENEQRVVEHQKWILKNLQNMWEIDVVAAKGFLDDIIRMMNLNEGKK